MNRPLTNWGFLGGGFPYSGFEHLMVILSNWQYAIVICLP